MQGGTLFLRCNTERFPFNNYKMRKAVQELLWCCRKRLAEESSITSTGPAHSLLSEEPQSPCKPSLQRAHLFFEEALAEIPCQKEALPKLDLIFNTPSLEKLLHTIAKTLRENFGLLVEVHKGQTPNSKKLADGQFHLALGIWDSWLSEPSYTLDCFKYKGDWEDPAFIAALEQASTSLDPDERRCYLKRAEKILLEAIPVIPLFQKKGGYLKKRHINNVIFSSNGEIDLKWASLQ